MPVKLQTDEQLMHALAQGDSKAFTALFDRYWQSLFAAAFHYLKDREASSDVVHDIFLNIWMKKDRLVIHSFKAYVTMAVRYQAYKNLQAAGSIKIEVLPEEAVFTKVSTVNYGAEKMQLHELELHINAHLEKLPKRCIEIYNLSRKEHLSNDEIAQHFSISKRTVENQLTYALRHLRVLIKSFR